MCSSGCVLNNEEAMLITSLHLFYKKIYKINDDFHSVLLLAQQNCNIFYFLCQYLNALITTPTIFIKKIPICYQS